jgi:ribosome biogenesis GTPase
MLESIEARAALHALGWTPFFHQQYLSAVGAEAGGTTLAPARVVSVNRGEYVLLDASGRRRAVLSGKLEARLLDQGRPCVGDFVLALDTGPDELTRVECVFERTSLFRRKAPGPTARSQSIAANVDLAIVLGGFSALGADPHAQHHGVNPRRIERYLRAIAEAPARPLVVLNKSDLRPDTAEIAEALGRELGGVCVLAVSARTGDGVDGIARHVAAHGTAVLVGSSGVGKSSLTNRLLLSDEQRVEAVREADTRGRHTTTSRELFVLPTGGVVIDTPGMREFGLAAEDRKGENQTGFSELDGLSGDCRFRDCRHISEPGCAVLEAVRHGNVAAERLEHAHKLQRELDWQKARTAVMERRSTRQRSRAEPRAGQPWKLRRNDDADDS